MANILRAFLPNCLLACLFAFLTTAVLADDYSFDASSFAAKRLEINYRLDFRPGFSWLESASRLHRLTVAASGARRSQSVYSLLAGTNGSYKAGDNSTLLFDGLLSLNRVLGQTRDSQVLNEFYIRFDLNSRLQAGIGKKTYKWGKSYAWNPVNFFGRQKDLNDIDLALSGYSMLFSQYSRSMTGYMSNMTLTMALMPVKHNLNDDFTQSDSLNFASQLYMLLGNTDIDLYLMAGSGGNHKFGADFSHNLSSNHEIHAELAHELQDDGYKILANGNIVANSQSGTNFIAGTRYLDSREITYILEYLHNDNGFNQSEMQNFYDSADLALATGNKPAKQLAAQSYSKYLNRQFAMQNYLYFKASKPELFGDLYLNGAAFTVFNLADKSSSTSFEISYTGQTDQITTLRLTGNLGNTNSEFGQKLNSEKIELRCQYFF